MSRTFNWLEATPAVDSIAWESVPALKCVRGIYPVKARRVLLVLARAAKVAGMPVRSVSAAFSSKIVMRESARYLGPTLAVRLGLLRRSRL